MHGMRLSHIAGGDPLVVAPIPQWSLRQAAFQEGGSSQAALLSSPTIVGNLLVAIGMYRRDLGAGLPAVVWSELSGLPYTLMTGEKVLEGNGQFERGLFVYALKITASTQRLSRVTTGQDCIEVPPDEIGTDCDVCAVLIVELSQPGGGIEDPASFNVTPVKGNNGATSDGLTVESDAALVVPQSFQDGFLYVGITGWRIEPVFVMAGLSWSPNQLNGGGIKNDTGLHGLSINFGAHSGNETFTPEATFVEGSNSGLIMSAFACEYTN